MLLGIDVGGTHTDGVVIGESGITAAAKVGTDHDNLLSSIRAVLKIVLKEVDPSQIKRMNLSTTLSTNSIIQGKTEEVGVIVTAGPGIDPEEHRIGRHYYKVDGFVDHRGTPLQALDQDQLLEAVTSCRRHGVRVWASAGKFSTRNPEHEEGISKAIGQDIDFITKGHRLSGVLNFPRRVATAYFNSAVWRIYNDFAWAVEESVTEFGMKADINILKADGGTMPLEMSKDMPVESILSGPAASVMGIIALCDIDRDSIILDIGGTTTDIAVFADGAPIIEHDGMTVGSYPTLVRALKIRSIGIGGDSALHKTPDGVKVGPDRQGPALAACPLNGREQSKAKKCTPALTDAMNYLGITNFGDKKASVKGIQDLAGSWGMDPEDLSQKVVDYAIAKIKEACESIVKEINDKPVYTIHELLRGKIIKPERIYIMGGPAGAFSELFSKSQGLEVVAPEHYSVANAIGAALTRTTFEVMLFADTLKGRLIVPNLNISKEIPRDYNLSQAEQDAKSFLMRHMKEIGVEDEEIEPEITEAESFNMVEGPASAGKSIRIKCQIRPGVLNKQL